MGVCVVPTIKSNGIACVYIPSEAKYMHVEIAEALPALYACIYLLVYFIVVLHHTPEYFLTVSIMVVRKAVIILMNKISTSRVE